jgi:hypothetical protein
MFILGWRSQNCELAKGYMYCPTCRSRKPATQGVRKTYFTVSYLALVPMAEHESYYQCDGCQGIFDPDARCLYDFGDHSSPKLWICTHCKSSNPNHKYCCQSCGADA